MREMKNSGVEWIGDIPADWKILKIKNIAKRSVVKNHSDKQVLSLYRELGIVIKSERNDNHNVTSENTDNYNFVEQNDIVVNKMKAWQGSIAVSNYEGIVSPAYYVYKIISKGIFPRYIHYIFRCSAYLPEYRRLSGGIRIGQWDLSDENFKNIPFVLPSFDEQHRIADYLDEKCAKIDAVIEKQKQVIEKLKEYKLSVITEAVTKGLDPTVPMKNSGVEWIGEIPEGWKVRKLRYLGSCINGISKGGEYFGRGYPFVSYGDVYKNIQLPKQVNGLVDTTEKEREWYSVKEGDVFFTRTSETIEEVALTSTCMQTIENATFAGFLIRFRPDTDLLVKEFSKYYFRSTKHRAFFVKEMNLVTRASLSQELLKRLPVLLPPVSEQMEISKYLEQKCSEIDSAISKKQAIVEKLTEYKKSLIYEVITGKKEV